MSSLITPINHCEANCGKPHAWEYIPYQMGYRKRCALLGCVAHQDVKDVIPVGMEDLGVYIPEKHVYERTPTLCGIHHWEPWYGIMGMKYARKCYFCNWWQMATGLQDII